MKNPINKVKEENNLTLEEFAIIAGVSQSTIYKNIQGSNRTVNQNILKACEELGYNPNKIEKRFQDFKEFKKRELLQKK